MVSSNPSDDDLPSTGDVQHYVSLIREGNPDVEGSRALLRLFCARARKLKFPESPFPVPLLELLVSAFEGYLSGDEPDIKKSLGLTRRGKPPNHEIQKRNKFIAADVFRRIECGESLGSSRDGDGAFVAVAEKYGLSEGEVRDIYYKNKTEGMAIVLMERMKDDSA